MLLSSLTFIHADAVVDWILEAVNSFPVPISNCFHAIIVLLSKKKLCNRLIFSILPPFGMFDIFTEFGGNATTTFKLVMVLSMAALKSAAVCTLWPSFTYHFIQDLICAALQSHMDLPA